LEPELTPLSLGELLRRARDARGFSLDRVEQDTRIRRAHLVALEGDDLRALPAPVFTRGLVRTYARYLGADITEAIEFLNKEEARQETPGVLPAARPPNTAMPVGMRVIWGSVVVAGLLLVGGVLYVTLPLYQAFFAATTVRAQATVVPSATPVPSATAAPTPVPPPTRPPSPTPPPSVTPPPTATMSSDGRATATPAAAMLGVKVEARATARVWTQVEADGEVVFSGLLMPGEQKTWKAERRIFMHLGDAALVELTHNGRQLGPAGPPGKVVKLEWSSSR